MLIDDLELRDLKYRVDLLKPKDSILKKYPELEIYPEIKYFKHKNKEMIMRAVVLLYSHNSPFIMYYQNRNDRYLAVYQYLYIKDGLNPPKVVPDEWLNIFDRKEEPIKMLVNCYLSKIQKYYEFEMLITFEDMFYEMQETLRTVILDLEDDKKIQAIAKKTAISKDCLNVIQSIKALKNEIFMSDKELIAESVKYMPVKPENQKRERVVEFE